MTARALILNRSTNSARYIAVVDQIIVTMVCYKRMFASLIIKTKLGVLTEVSDSDTAIER